MPIQEHAKLGIKDVEEMVGKKAQSVEIRARDILLHFGGTGYIGGCHIGPHEGGTGADITWRLPRW